MGTEVKRPCKGCDGVGSHENATWDPDQPERVPCPDCWGAGTYEGSITEHYDKLEAGDGQAQ